MHFMFEDTSFCHKTIKTNTLYLKLSLKEYGSGAYTSFLIPRIDSFS